MVPAVIAIVFALAAFLMPKLFSGAVRGLNFGSDIRKTMGTVAGEHVRGTTTALTLHALDRLKTRNAVGIEVEIKNNEGQRMYTFRLTVDEARELASLLESAAGPGPSKGWIKHPEALDEV